MDRGHPAVMSVTIPASRNLHYVGTSRVAERLTLAPGINAFDGEPFDPETVDLLALERGSYVPHLGDPIRGSMLAADGRHVAVPHLLGRLLGASETTARLGAVLAGGGGAVAAAVTIGGGTPGASLAVAGTGIALRLAARAAARLGRGRIEAELAAIRGRVATLEEGLAEARAVNDADASGLADAVTILRDPGISATDRVAAAKARLGVMPEPGIAP